MSHWEKYARAYLMGLVFVIVTIGNAFVSEFENMTPAQESAMTGMQWAVAYFSMAVSAGTTLLAFFNQSSAGKQPAQPDQPNSQPSAS